MLIYFILLNLLWGLGFFSLGKINEVFKLLLGFGLLVLSLGGGIVFFCEGIFDLWKKFYLFDFFVFDFDM